MTIRFKSPGWFHSPIEAGSVGGDARQAVMIDKGNSIDMFYAATDLANAFPRMELYDVPYAGHYVARALLVSRCLKNTLSDFLLDRPFTFNIDRDAVVAWHRQAFHGRIKKGFLGHAIENLEAIMRADPQEAAYLSQELNAAFAESSQIGGQRGVDATPGVS